MVEHLFGSGELFFSTTDAQGRIRRANSTFMRLSGYPRGALVGRAHSVVRHDDMPAGLFRTVWEGIEDAAPVCAYITNRSADGGHYRVFATIVPSGGGYLSVRTLPMMTGLRDDVEQAYTRVREVERSSAQAGSSRREAAAAGQAALLRELAEMGYSDAADFTRRVLPDEVAALLASGAAIPAVPQTQGPVAQILAAMHAIEADTSGLVGVLEEGKRLVGLLGRRAEEISGLSERLGRLRQTLRAVSGEVRALGAGPEAEEVEERYQEVDALILECVEQLRPLRGQVEELRSDVDAVRFDIALTRLHNLAAGTFAVQIIEGQDEVGANDAVGSLEELCTVLGEDAVRLAEQIELLEARGELVGGELDVVAESLTLTHAPLMELLGAAADAGAAQETSVRTARSLVRDGFPEARSLADLASSLRQLSIPYQAERTGAHLDQVRTALAELGV
ncbi:PAS domain-containing protein [Actinomyces bowdenii]|uniref:Chemotaxis protein n=1 Tax=Actinomyces bowdenii TaxID=131109 RepID=A0A853EMG1_9ACTO|nr:PAS domain-containing protein [Actinomyces bowdenii]MBF0697527.1 PAS domain-containing protein [Actinomyces bowdenii]MDO5065576.1 PAS domain-containing protein [Actinomyces bowdenii]NYS69700.1 chemotaxis protein [Actinomyces bowdenii]